MPDQDELREGTRFGVGIPVKNQTFYIKGADHLSWGAKDRMSRIFDKKSGRSVMLAFDHGFIQGPTHGVERVDLTIQPLMQYADCLMCSRGILQTSVPADTGKPICLRADAGTSVLTSLNDNVVMAVESAVNLNASAMAIMVAIGDKDVEAKTIANLYHLADAADKYGMPILGVTAVGKDMQRDARYFGLATRICAENGATFVKTYYCEDFANIVSACPVPIVIAGGKKLPELQALEMCYKAINDGAAGVDMGRNVFQSESPVSMLQAVRAVVHEGLTPEQGFEMFNDLSSK